MPCAFLNFELEFYPLNNRRKVLVVLVDRANYGRLKPVMCEIKNHHALELQTVCAGTMVLKRFDYTTEIVRDDGFEIHGEVFVELEGSTPTTMAKSVGFATIEFASEFQRLKPDVVLLIGDRYEALAAAIAAAYMNIPIVHLQGGEVSGSIDESARHAISKFAQFHVPSTKRAAEFLVRMGEHEETILTIGCPSSDIARMFDGKLTNEIVNERGSGLVLDVSKPYLLVVFHPITTEYGDEWNQMDELLNAVAELAMQTILLWPNIDAGSDQISKAIRTFRDLENIGWLRTLTNLSPENYLRVLRNTACAIGNSSSFVRDASYFGTPVVLVGNRQRGRETGEHVTQASASKENILQAIRRQLEHGRYSPNTLYGDGRVSERIAESIANLQPYIQKRLAYYSDEKSAQA